MCSSILYLGFTMQSFSSDSNDIVQFIWIYVALNHIRRVLDKYIGNIESVGKQCGANKTYVLGREKPSYHLFVLPPSDQSFAVPKVGSSLFEWDFAVLYRSLQDMIDIKNCGVPQFFRRFVPLLKYCGGPRQAWIDLTVDLVEEWFNGIRRRERHSWTMVKFWQDFLL